MLRRLYIYTCTLQIFLHRQSVQDTQSTVKPLSRAVNPSKNEVKRSIAFCTSCEPAVSLIECMDSMALPTSTVRIPIFDSIGPTVDPQGLGRWMRFCCHRNKRDQGLHVIPNFKLLDFPTLPFHELLHDKRCDSVASISLFGIRFDNNATIHAWFVLFFMLGSVIGVHGMTHVC